MAKYIYKNYTVVVDDPQDRLNDLKEGSEITVHMKRGSDDSFEIRVPEKKVEDNTPKAQPETIYENKQLNVKGTITVTNRLKVGVDINIKKALEVGEEQIKDSLVRSLEKTYGACLEREKH